MNLPNRFSRFLLCSFVIVALSSASIAVATPPGGGPPAQPPQPPPNSGINYPGTPPADPSFYNNINQAYDLLQDLAKTDPTIAALLACVSAGGVDINPTSSDDEGPSGGAGGTGVPGFVNIPPTANGIPKVIPPESEKYRDELPDKCPPNPSDPNDGNGKYPKYPRDIQILAIILAHELGHVCGHSDEGNGPPGSDNVGIIENAVRGDLGFCLRTTYRGKPIKPSGPTGPTPTPTPNPSPTPFR